MATYRVTVLIDARVIIDVQADNEEAAKEMALIYVDRPCICHQCSRELDIGDPYEVAEVWKVSDGR